MRFCLPYECYKPHSSHSPSFYYRVICTVVKSTQSFHVSLRVFIQHAVPLSLLDTNTPSPCSIKSQPPLFLACERPNFARRYKQHAKLCFCTSILVFREVNFTDHILCGRKRSKSVQWIEDLLEKAVKGYVY